MKPHSERDVANWLQFEYEKSDFTVRQNTLLKLYDEFNWGITNNCPVSYAAIQMLQMD